MLRWEACRHPEREPDAATTFVVGCPGCELALRAAITIRPAAGAFEGWWRERDTIGAQLDDA